VQYHYQAVLEIDYIMHSAHTPMVIGARWILLVILQLEVVSLRHDHLLSMDAIAHELAVSLIDRLDK
jgi:hypothetical protein